MSPVPANTTGELLFTILTGEFVAIIEGRVEVGVATPL
jgi:hypothetical protein